MAVWRQFPQYYIHIHHTVVCTKRDSRMRKMKGLVILFVVAITTCHKTSGQGMPHVMYFLGGKRWVIVVPSVGSPTSVSRAHETISICDEIHS